MYGSLDELKIEIDLLAAGAERIVGKTHPLDIIARDVLFGEGPVWDARNKQFFFTDIIGDTIWKWEPNGELTAILKPSAKANGLALDLENRLLVAGWGGRTVFRFEHDGSRTEGPARVVCRAWRTGPRSAPSYARPACGRTSRSPRAPGS